MKIITPTIHGIIDYMVVIFLALSPTIFGISGGFGLFLYVLAGVHLLLTILTDYRAGLIHFIPLKIHGWIELLVSISLILLPWIFGFTDDRKAFIFSVSFGIAVFGVWILSDYKSL